LRTIGLIGGMSWESTAEYYRIINQTVRDRLGPLRSAPVLLLSVDFGPIERAQRDGRWDDAGAILADAAVRLQAGGAECVALCTNTMHRVAAAIQAVCTVPFLHIADAIGPALERWNGGAVGLLGTRFTMSQPFLRDRLAADYGLKVLVPDPREQDSLHRIIYEELCAGVIREESRVHYQAAIASLAARGAGAIVLGCTEISLLVKPADAVLPLFDSTALHAVQAVDFALASDGTARRKR
jgi:aspartate racemase